MKVILIRFFVGGFLVSVFSLLGDLFKPKSFAGLFGAAPSVALATIGLTVVSDGKSYASMEASSMLAGAFAFLAYASCVSWVMMHRRLNALRVTIFALPIWGIVAFALWDIWLR